MLPELPKKRKHEEADITPYVIQWFFDNWPRSVAGEIKIIGEKPKPHQLVFLWQVFYGKFKLKLKDWGGKNPFDFLILKKDCDAFVITCKGRACHVKQVGVDNEFDIKV